MVSSMIVHFVNTLTFRLLLLLLLLLGRLGTLDDRKRSRRVRRTVGLFVSAFVNPDASVRTDKSSTITGERTKRDDGTQVKAQYIRKHEYNVTKDVLPV